MDNSHVLYLGNFPGSNWRGSEKTHNPHSGLLMAGLFKPRYPDKKWGAILCDFDRTSIIVNWTYCAKFKGLFEFLISQDSMVSIGTGSGLDNWETVFRFLSGTSNFSLLQYVWTSSGVQWSSKWVHRTLFGVESLGHKTDYLLPLSVKVMNEWIQTSLSHISS